MNATERLEREEQKQMVQAEIDKLSKEPVLEAAIAYAKLKDTPEWKSIFDDYLLSSEIIRLVNLKADPNAIEHVDTINNSITMCGELQTAFQAIEGKANMVKTNINNNQAYIDQSNEVG